MGFPHGSSKLLLLSLDLRMTIEEYPIKDVPCPLGGKAHKWDFYMAPVDKDFSKSTTVSGCALVKVVDRPAVELVSAEGSSL